MAKITGKESGHQSLAESKDSQDFIQALHISLGNSSSPVSLNFSATDALGQTPKFKN